MVFLSVSVIFSVGDLNFLHRLYCLYTNTIKQLPGESRIFSVEDLILNLDVRKAEERIEQTIALSYFDKRLEIIYVLACSY